MQICSPSSRESAATADSHFQTGQINASISFNLIQVQVRDGTGVAVRAGNWYSSMA
jgi:hypothetical protein